MTLATHRKGAGWRYASLASLTWLALLTASQGCNSPDPALLVPEDASRTDSGHAPLDAGDTRDAAAGAGGGAAVGGMGGGGTGGEAGDATEGGVGGTGGNAGCHPNPDTDNEVCREICPELCNDEDDDCDRRIDEAAGLCELDHALSLCRRGTCLIISCNSGFRDCNGQDADGCEAELASDPSNCGGCGKACNFPHTDEACVDNTCTAAGCESGWADCDDTSPNCETETNTLADCAGCDTPCTGLDQASPTCESGGCKVKTCLGNFGDCDGDDATGCETPLDSFTDCGGCDVSCAKVSCAGGVCSAVVCGDDTADCDGDEIDCEVDLSGDVDHCGGCTTACLFTAADPHAVLACVARDCVAVCDPGRDDCDGDYATGCETAVDNVAQCGACGFGCDTQLVHTSTTACNVTTFSCEIVDCAPKFGDCDGVHATGCETDFQTTENCGGCANLAENEPCTGLPEVASSACGAGSCVVTGCNPSFLDCDGAAANGCERDMSVEGPCAPDTNCTQHTFAGHTYFVCTNPSTWMEARDKCRLQLGGDLATVDGMAENAFLQANAGANAWIGAGDLAIEGVWAWSSQGVPFWLGASGGAPVLGGYANWLAGQPSNTGDEDCGELRNSDGKWTDLACATTKAFVCEVTPDECPADENKHYAGQCGCGSADTDADSDGFAVCNDACESDPGKRAVGVCGCGVADTDNDMDGTPNCNDGCPDDNAKIAPGTCDCGTPDTDSDMDGTANCLETCDDDPDKVSPGICGCGTADTNTDGDGEADCNETCDDDPLKLAPGACGCGTADTNTDGDGEADCNETCDDDPLKLAPGACGCGIADTNTDGDSQVDCNETCDDDPLKLAPGACGCGIADTDTDLDSYPDCIEVCDGDPGKQDPGVCGCGTADVDSDGDMTFDCDDGCDADASKIAPGACGCGYADTDGDGDATADCVDLCPLDPARNVPPCAPCTGAFSNITRGDYAYSADLVIGCNATYDSTGAGGGGFTVFGAGCSGAPTPVVYNGMVVLPMNSMAVTGGFTLKVVGDKPVIFAVAQNAVINGHVNADAVLTVPGAGGASPTFTGACAAANNGAVGSTPLNPYTTGSGGGGFGTAGGMGGRGWNPTNGGAGGTVGGTATLVPLRGGCRGANGFKGTGLGGAGGGGVQISTGGTLTIGAAGKVSAAGGGGAGGTGTNWAGGAGGGSGGAVLLEGWPVVNSGWITANGGGGGGTRYVNNGGTGQNGSNTSNNPAAGGAADNLTYGGPGGVGGVPGAAGAQGGESNIATKYSGGGGGGGAGRILTLSTSCGAQTVNINNTGGGALTDYQVKVTFNATDALWSRVQSSGNDLRFTDTMGAQLSYWIESWDYAAKTGTVWIKVPLIPAGQQVQLYMNYGTGLPAMSNLDATMVWGDDFSTSGTMTWTKLRGGSEWNTSWGWSTCGLTTGGQVYCWGYNGEYALGSGDNVDRWLPNRVALSDMATDMDVGRRNGVALTNDGQVWSWGLNTYNELGDGTATTRSTPVKVLGGAVGGTYLTSATEVEAGGIHQFAILNTGELASWGYNGNGTLGDGTNVQRSSPVKVVKGESPGGTYLTGVTQVSAAGRTACALLNTGRVMCWGRNDWGNLGKGDASAVNTNFAPAFVHDAVGACSAADATCTAADQSGCLANIVEIAVDMYNGCARGDAGQVYCWGYGANYALGNGGTATSNCPVKVLDNANAVEGDGDGVLDTCVSISVGARHASCVLSDGRMVQWGLREEAGTNATYPEVKAGGANDFVKAESMSLMNCGIRSTGQASCWGRNDYGGIGIGTATTYVVPITAIETMRLPDTAKWNRANEGNGTFVVSSGRLAVTAVAGDFWSTADTAPYAVSNTAFGTSYITETRVVSIGWSNTNRSLGVRSGSATNARMFNYVTDTGPDHMSAVVRDTVGGSAAYYGDNTGPVIGNPGAGLAKLVVNGDNVTTYFNGALMFSRTTAGYNLQYPSLGDSSPAGGNVYEHTYVRKYAAVEPVVTLGN